MTATWWNPSNDIAAPTKRSKLIECVDVFVKEPTSEHFSVLYQLTRRTTVQTLLFSTKHSSLSLRLLDVLVDYVLTRLSSHETVQHSLELLHLFSKQTAIGYPSHTMGKLLQWLTNAIISATLDSIDSILKLQLLVLAEMLKKNAGVCIYIKEMKQIKEFYRALTILLNSTEDAEFLIYSMVILARLVLNETLGTKLFSPKNVDQALDLVFSVLEGTWQEGDYQRDLQMLSIDLLCELADRTDILSALEHYSKLAEVFKQMLYMIHINANTPRLETAIAFTIQVMSLSPLFRKQVLTQIADTDVFYRILSAILHPSKYIGMRITQLVVQAIGDEFRPFQELLETNKTLLGPQLSPIITSLFRIMHDTSAMLQKCQDLADLVETSEDYLLSVEICPLLTKLCEVPCIRSYCVQAIRLNSCATIIQVESTQLHTMDPSQLVEYHPKLSLQVVMLLSCLVHDSTMEDKHQRTLHQFLQSSEVSMIVGAALVNHPDKSVVVDTLLLVQQYVQESSNPRFYVQSIGESILHVNQRHSEASEHLQTKIQGLETTAATQLETIEKLQQDIQQVLQIQTEEKKRYDQEIQSIRMKCIEQIHQKDDVLTKTRELYEEKLRELTQQCENMAQVMNKKMQMIQQRDQMLHEQRTQRAVLEEEVIEWKRKVHGLERRLEEIAQQHSITLEENTLREKELQVVRDEILTISDEYTSQREEMERLQLVIKNLEENLTEQTQSQEKTFKELVLLSKAHQTMSNERDEYLKEMEGMRDELTRLESINITVQSKVVEKRDMIEQLEHKIKRLEDAAMTNQHALELEREKRRTGTRELEELRKAYRKMENEMAMSEIQAAETRVALESKEQQLGKYEEEIRQLSHEVQKQTKLQSLIHQLSSGGDPQTMATSTLLARDN